MKPKFEEFNDGLVGIYRENKSGVLERALDYNLRFGNENVSASRHYAAKAADTSIDRIIHIPLIRERVDIGCYAVLDNEQYRIEKVDFFYDNLPPINKLTLKKLNKHRKKVFADGEKL